MITALMIFGFTALLAVGVLASQTVDSSMPFGEKLSLGYLLASGMITFLAFLLNLLGAPFSVHSFLGIIVVLMAILFVINRRALPSPSRHLQDSPQPMFSWIWRVPIGLWLAYSAIAILLYGAVAPVTDWDSLAVYDFRARSFVATGYMHDAIARGYFFPYPLYISLLHTWGYLFGFAHITFLHGLMYLSMSACIYYGVRRYASEWYALMVMLFIVVAPGLATHAMMTYTNLGYIVYLTLAVLYFGIATKEQSERYYLLGFTLLGLNMWVRSTEPFGLLTLLIASIWYLLTTKRSIKHRILFLIIGVSIPLVIKCSWNFFQNYHMNRVPPKVAAQSGPHAVYLLDALSRLESHSVARLQSVMEFLGEHALSHHADVLVAFLLSIVLMILRRSYRDRFISLLFLFNVANILVLVIGTYVFSLMYDTWQEIPQSLQRMALFLPPILLLFILSVTREYLEYFFPSIGTSRSKETR